MFSRRWTQRSAAIRSRYLGRASTRRFRRSERAMVDRRTATKLIRFHPGEVARLTARARLTAAR